MRFPWLQVDSDVIEAKAGDLSVLIDCSRREAIGLLVDLWAWCLTRSPKDIPPDGIVTGTAPVPSLERAASWTGPEGKLYASLTEVGFIEPVEGGFRFRGIGRYRSTWAKNRRRKESGVKPAENRSGSVGDSSRKTQTQTQIETTTLPPAIAVAAVEVDERQRIMPGFEPPPRPAEPEPEAPKPPRRPSAGEELYAKIQRVRKAICEDAGESYVDDRWEFARQNKLLGPVAKGSEHEKAVFDAAFTEYVSDEAHKAKGWPLSLFMHGATRARYEKKALDALRAAS